MNRRIAIGAIMLTAASSMSALAGGVVTSATPESTAAGVEILEAGGNAMDAAIAVQFALAVTEPAMSGLGGGVQIILKKPGEAPLVINGTTRAPQNLPPNVTARQAQTGRTASTVPTAVKTMDLAFRAFGSGEVSWSALLAPAIRNAEEGWVVGPFRARVYARHADDLRRDPSVATLFLDEHRRAPDEGAVVKSPVLAKTLRRLAEKGAEDFYTGEIAREIAQDMEENGGWISYDDLASLPDPEILEPIHADYRSARIFTLPPPAGGWVMLQALNLLELEDDDTLCAESDQRALALARALSSAHASRRSAPIGGEMNEAVYEQISDETAQALFRSDGGETTHFTVVDADGFVVSVTSSINRYFGAWAASEELGFLYNNYMSEFVLDDERHPFALRPGAAPLSSMSAAIVTQEGAPTLALGSPGSARIISAVAQVISHYLDIQEGVEAAVFAPRIHAAPDGDIYVEGRSFAPALLSGLAGRGFTLRIPESDLGIGERNAYFGGVHAVAKTPLGWRGAADPRRDGSVGYADAIEDAGRPPARD